MGGKFAEALAEHDIHDKERFMVINETIKDFHADIKTIKENHLAHMQASLTSLETNMAWVQKLTWVAVAGIGGGFVEQLWHLIR